MSIAWAGISYRQLSFPTSWQHHKSGLQLPKQCSPRFALTSLSTGQCSVWRLQKRPRFELLPVTYCIFQPVHRAGRWEIQIPTRQSKISDQFPRMHRGRFDYCGPHRKGLHHSIQPIKSFDTQLELCYRTFFRWWIAKNGNEGYQKKAEKKVVTLQSSFVTTFFIT